MTLPLVFRPEVRDEINEACKWYDQRLRNLGDRFLAAVELALESIQANPCACGLVHRDVRAALLKRFPYLIYYRIEASRIVVVAIQHGRQHSRRWKSRL